MTKDETKNRREFIIKTVKQNAIYTQDMLLECLKNAGFEVTQATISRDIKKLGLTKVKDGVSTKYQINDKVSEDKRFFALFQENATSAEAVNNLACIKCYQGMASAICAVFDEMHRDDVALSIAGDDSILIVFYESKNAKSFVEKLNTLLE